MSAEPRPTGDEDRWPDLRFVFVVTYARSGSTLLQSLMNSCPGVQIRGENNNALFHLSQAISEVKRTRREHSGIGSSAADRPWYGADRMRPKLFETALLQSFVRRVLVPDAGIKVTGFKEIRYTSPHIPTEQFAPYMDFLLAQFPRSMIVFNSRKGADVAKSGFVARLKPEVVQDWVRENDEQFTRYAARSDRTVHVRYEDYVADHTVIHRMLDRLGLDWTAERVEEVFAKPLIHAQGGA